jgi:hypothetical protein
MQLTKAQERTLELYLKWRSSPPTFWFLISQNLIRYLIHLVLVIFLVLLAPLTGEPWIGWIAIGLFLGVLLRDIGLFQRSVRLWPMTSAVLDWERIDELLAESSSL